MRIIENKLNILKHMKLVIALVILSMITMSTAYSPEPTPMELVNLCENTEGTISEEWYAPDCGPGCNAMPITYSDCHCTDGKVYMDIMHINFTGCDGNEPICETDYDCQRTSQGNECMNGTCGYVDEPSCIPMWLILGIIGCIGFARYV